MPSFKSNGLFQDILVILCLFVIANWETFWKVTLRSQNTLKVINYLIRKFSATNNKNRLVYRRSAKKWQFSSKLWKCLKVKNFNIERNLLEEERVDFHNEPTFERNIVSFISPCSRETTKCQWIIDDLPTESR